MLSLATETGNVSPVTRMAASGERSGEARHRLLERASDQRESDEEKRRIEIGLSGVAQSLAEMLRLASGRTSHSSGATSVALPTWLTLSCRVAR
jgi:hypothetical protein